jgi:hypothetical protein
MERISDFSPDSPGLRIKVAVIRYIRAGSGAGGRRGRGKDVEA